MSLNVAVIYMSNVRKVYFNLSFDDIHPESSRDGTDCGGDRDDGVFKYFLKLWKIYPRLKITLFVTPNWTDRANDWFILRRIKGIIGLKYTNTWNDEPFNLLKHKEWCQWINSFLNFEILVHGYNHHADRKLHSQEFDGMNKNECRLRLEDAENIMTNAKLLYTRGFRPPGWGISTGLFEALVELKYDFVSLDPIPCSIEGMSRYKVEMYKGLMNVPQNWDIAYGTPDEAIVIAKKYGFLTAKGHISNYYDGEKIGNGLNEKTFSNVCLLLERLMADEEVDIVFATMGDIAREMVI